MNKDVHFFSFNNASETFIKSLSSRRHCEARSNPFSISLGVLVLKKRLLRASQ